MLLCLQPLTAAEINAASQAELESIKGIGPTLSQRIVEERGQRIFTNWTDLLQRVSGLGGAIARRLSAQGLTVNAQPYVPVRPASAESGASR